MADTDQPTAADLVRGLARRGLLTRYARTAPESERRRLRAGAFEIVFPLVFRRVRRPIERRRGHHLCATGLQRLAPDCLDQFHDDVDAVLHDLFAHADVPIENLEGWLTMRIPRATVDGYRRRRGGRGALQRPRVPGWLATELGGDRWLTELATSILDWAGAETTAGTSLWPVSSWTERRAAITGDHAAGESPVPGEIELVLAAMRRRPTWYDKFVERPLGRKRAPVHLPPRTAPGARAEPQALAPVERYEKDDALLLELADRAITLIRRRVGAGESPHAAVSDVLGTVFGELPASYDLDRSPGDGLAGPERVLALIDDPERLNHIVATVVGMLRRPSER
ncbi:hypothetical protein [Actinoplanes siamensis]|uniref:Uncharacterized protein n=1 Tax=Actinoplanes siamensis TaxID=1223317 RepID=A0A919TLQ1_9ACTN|nr:hypothetical protein [Actinoplanes siamensis]GIF06847.1 hypothetical protein Asi03nite_43850 [Actinoplanes siamensis]